MVSETSVILVRPGNFDWYVMPPVAQDDTSKHIQKQRHHMDSITNHG